MTRAIAVVLAAGQGRRLGGVTPKPLVPICGRPLVLRTLDRIFAANVIEQVVLVVPTDQISRCESLLRSDEALHDRPWVLQPGGATRQQSSSFGLRRVPVESEIVMIHDGARPFVSAGLIERAVQAAAERQAVVAGLPVRDTIKVVSRDGWVQSTLERSTLWEIQTPQAFNRSLIDRAHRAAEGDPTEATDDAMLVERLGVPVYVVPGERSNLKITAPEDVLVAEALLRQWGLP
jgi:2-C-methyl-D-erythritol 4-phosphate cytidylyltransferase